MLLCVEGSLLFIIHHLLTCSLPQDSWFVIACRTVVLSSLAWPPPTVLPQGLCTG